MRISINCKQHPTRAVTTACLIVLAASADLFGQVPVLIERQKLVASDGNASDKFGTAIDREGDTLIIGAPEHYTNVLPGSFYVFTRDGAGPWTEQVRVFSDLQPGQAEVGDQFGDELALEGDTLLVGAPLAELDGTTFVGRVYVFLRNAEGVWVQQQTLLPGDPNDSSFGRHIELVGDTAVITSVLHAFIYARDAAGIWSPLTELTGTGFESVGPVAFDGQTIVLGNGGFPAGDPQAVVFTNSGGGWSVSGSIVTPQGQMSSVADITFEGDHVALGLLDLADQDRVFVFQRDGSGAWVQQAMLDPDNIDDSFGIDVALRDGVLLAGAAHGGSNGIVHGFGRNASGEWTQTLQLNHADSFAGSFGAEIHFEDGLPVIGAPADHQNGPFAGAVYVFDEIRAAAAGDIDGDGDIDMADVAMFVDVLLETNADPQHVARSDLNADGVVDARDVPSLLTALLET